MKLTNDELKRKAKLSAFYTLRNLNPNKIFVKMELYYDLVIYNLYEYVKQYDSYGNQFELLQITDSIQLCRKTDYTRLPWGEKK